MAEKELSKSDCFGIGMFVTALLIVVPICFVSLCIGSQNHAEHIQRDAQMNGAGRWVIDEDTGEKEFKFGCPEAEREQ